MESTTSLLCGREKKWCLHGVWPVSCGETAPDLYQTANAIRYMTPLDVCAVVNRDPGFCEVFPRCWHQNYYLRSLGVPVDE